MRIPARSDLRARRRSPQRVISGPSFLTTTVDHEKRQEVETGFFLQPPCAPHGDRLHGLFIGLLVDKSKKESEIDPPTRVLQNRRGLKRSVSVIQTMIERREAHLSALLSVRGKIC